MDRVLYIAMSGAKQIMDAQAVNTNNLANANTVGFKADLSAFQSRPVTGPVYASRVYAQSESNGVDLRSGAMQSTGRALDVAIQGEGYIAVQAPDGSEAYTRAGNFELGAGGQLTTSSGHPVLGNGGVIAVPPYEKLDVGGDGTITIRPVGQSPATLATLDRIKLVKIPPDQLQKGTDGLLHRKEGGVAEADASVRVVGGALEGSNVSAVDSLVNMISLSRHFEMTLKAITAAEENDREASSILNL